MRKATGLEPENGVRLYDIPDRVSCWCCKNKNRKELKARIPLPMKPYSRKSIPYGNVFDLERAFEQEIQKERSASPKRKRRSREQSR